MYEGKKLNTDPENTQLVIQLDDNDSLGDLSEVGYYDTAIKTYLKYYPTVELEMYVRFAVNYPCDELNNNNKGFD